MGPEPLTVKRHSKTRRVRLWLALCATSLAIFIFIATQLDQWAPDARSDLAAGGFLPSLMFKIVATLLIGAPLMGLFHAIMSLGSNEGHVDQDGRIVLRVREGARHLQIGMCIALFALFSAGTYFLTDDDLTLRICSILGAVASVIACYIVWTSRIRYDETGLQDYRFARRPRLLKWAHLRKVTWIEPLNHYRMDFTKGRKTTISTSYAGHDRLIAFANRMSATNARTSRSGDRAPGIATSP